VPVENSLEGSVGVAVDALADEPAVAIGGEVVVEISYCLAARTALELAGVATVTSHPQALAQCGHFLAQRLPGAAVLPAPSTAEAMRLVAGRDEPWAALGTRRSAELYGCHVLVDDVVDEPGNATRFVWVVAADGAPAPAPGTAAKTSLAFWGSGDTSPGWLVRCLSEFAFRGVNLSKIESRPLRGRLGHYRFFVDCAGALADEPVAGAVEGLRAHCDEVRVLGSYGRS
jgi:prephenate dehydratase